MRDVIEMAEEARREKEDALAMESLSQGEYMSLALSGFAQSEGFEAPDVEWLLHPFDAWVKNPHYRGEPGAHPEDDEYWSATDEERAEMDAARRARRAQTYVTTPAFDDDIPF
ncbi:hypothetical protein BAMBUS_00400 [Brevundimonas phage vB_BpoS-Bambus]|nr:hypothetical protein BAMBUS_00400 [Brevundimonas phage vB_BpoS-Bambus]